MPETAYLTKNDIKRELEKNDYLIFSQPPYLVCIKPSVIEENTTHKGMLTVPVPDGYDAASAMRIVAWDMQSGTEDYSKVAVTDNKDGTITFPVLVRYWETAVGNESISVGEFVGHSYVEFKKPSASGKKDGESETTPDGKTYAITSNEADEVILVEFSADESGKVTVPDTVEINGKTYKVTEIASEELKNNKKVTSLTIGKNIKKIGKDAAAGCSKLTSVNLGKVEEIGDGAFSKCTSLKKITIPDTVTKIGKNAFNGDKKLKTITINSQNIKSIGKNAIKGIKKDATIKLKGTKKQKAALEKKLKKKSTGYKNTMKIKK